jgi:hypothetical protein
MDDALFRDKDRGILVTPRKFVVRSVVLPVSTIARVDLVRIRPKRLGGILLTLIGVVGATMTGSIPLPVTVLCAIGIGVAVVGAWLAISAKPSYAVRLATASGRRDAVVTDDERYAEKIVQALELVIGSER